MTRDTYLLHLKLELPLNITEVKTKLAAEYDTVETIETNDNATFVPAYNMQRKDHIPVLRQSHGHGHAPILHVMQWGLHPSWGEREGIGMPVVATKAVIEGTKDMWVRYRRRSRCAVVCQGFFIWRKHGRETVPYLYRLPDSRLLLLAGLYDVIRKPEPPLYSFTLLYQHDPTQKHTLFPVILRDSAAVTAWLDTSTQAWAPSLEALLAPDPKPDTRLTHHRVSPAIAQAGRSSPSLTRALPAPLRQRILESTFARQATPPASSTPNGSARRALRPPAREGLRSGPREAAGAPRAAAPRASRRQARRDARVECSHEEREVAGSSKE